MRDRCRGQDRGKKLIDRPEKLFALRLAKTTGRLLEADDILDSITGPQLAELAAFDRLEGIDDRSRWQRVEAVLAIGFATLANLWIAKGEKLEPDYFLPPAPYTIRRKREPDSASIAAQKAALRQIAAVHNSGR